MNTDDKLKILYTTAYEFLIDKIGQKSLEDKLNHYRQYKVDNTEDIFWHLMYSLTNKVGMRATIGDIDALSSFVFDYDATKTRNHYQYDWKKLFKAIKNNHTPPGPMNIKKENSYWAMYCKAILSGAAFLSEFPDFISFDIFANHFALNDITIAALPLMIEQEIYGMGFPLGCDWLKEMGYTNYAKPDTHTIAILFETGASATQGVYDIFTTMVRMARINNDTPSVVDRLLWLIGSGKYVDEGVKITRQRAIFIGETLPKLI